MLHCFILMFDTCSFSLAIIIFLNLSSQTTTIFIIAFIIMCQITTTNLFIWKGRMNRRDESLWISPSWNNQTYHKRRCKGWNWKRQRPNRGACEFAIYVFHSFITTYKNNTTMLYDRLCLLSFFSNSFHKNITLFACTFLYVLVHMSLQFSLFKLDNYTSWDARIDPLLYNTLFAHFIFYIRFVIICVILNDNSVKNKNIWYDSRNLNAVFTLLKKNETLSD